jgi:hypothetical protein
MEEEVSCTRLCSTAKESEWKAKKRYWPEENKKQARSCSTECKRAKRNGA